MARPNHANGHIKPNEWADEAKPMGRLNQANGQTQASQRTEETKPMDRLNQASGQIRRHLKDFIRKSHDLG